MALSDCAKCWSTPCECGHDYKHMSVQRLIGIRNAINEVIREKLESEQDNTWDQGGLR